MIAPCFGLAILIALTPGWGVGVGLCILESRCAGGRGREEWEGGRREGRRAGPMGGEMAASQHPMCGSQPIGGQGQDR